MGALFFLKGIIGIRLYRRSLVDIAETVTLLNLLIFSTFSLYKFQAGNTKQTAITYASTITTFVILMGGVVYHLILLIRRKRIPAEQDAISLVPLVQPVATSPLSEVTYSVVEISKPQPESSSQMIHSHFEPDHDDNVSDSVVLSSQ